MRIGELRVLLYALAIGTGLRRGELRRLRWCDLDLQNGLLTVPAASAKSRREQAVDLHPRLVEALKSARREDTDPLATVIPGDCHPTTRTFHMDLVAAGIAKEQRISLEPNPKGHTFKRRFDTRDATGRVIDFHALRTTFISWLNMTGAHPRTAQALARHANIETTMARYTDIRLVDLRAAVERLPLPALPPPSPPESVPLPVPLSTVTEPHSGAQPSTGGTEASSS
jgi:integrase